MKYKQKNYKNKQKIGIENKQNKYKKINKKVLKNKQKQQVISNNIFKFQLPI